VVSWVCLSNAVGFVHLRRFFFYFNTPVKIRYSSSAFGDKKHASLAGHGGTPFNSVV
jgi:hypothetical protein